MFIYPKTENKQPQETLRNQSPTKGICTEVVDRSRVINNRHSSCPSNNPIGYGLITPHRSGGEDDDRIWGAINHLLLPLLFDALQTISRGSFHSNSLTRASATALEEHFFRVHRVAEQVRTSFGGGKGAAAAVTVKLPFYYMTDEERQNKSRAIQINNLNMEI